MRILGLDNTKKGMQMIISQTIAQKIIIEVASVISTSVNLMDAQGKIIASTNPLRVGTIHYGAVQILENNLTELYIQNEDITANVRPGLNLPIVIENKAIGVVGLTGKFEEVAQIGRIVKKMTEVLLREELAKKKRDTENFYWDHFLELLLMGNEKKQETVDLASLLGFDLEMPKSIVLLTTIGYRIGELTNQERWFELNRILNSILQPFSLKAYPRDNQWLIFLPYTDKHQVLDKMGPVIENFSAQSDIQLRFGVSSLNETHFNYQRAYIQCQKALIISASKCNNYFIYNDSSIELIAMSIDETSKLAFINQLFKNMESDKLADQILMIKTYLHNNGSISRCANELFIHPNTLQYKLINLAKHTGYDIRKPKDSTVFHIAALFYDFLNMNKELNKQFYLVDLGRIESFTKSS